MIASRSFSLSERHLPLLMNIEKPVDVAALGSKVIALVYGAALKSSAPSIVRP